jgi:hypothetical protein
VDWQTGGGSSSKRERIRMCIRFAIAATVAAAVDALPIGGQQHEFMDASQDRATTRFKAIQPGGPPAKARSLRVAWGFPGGAGSAGGDGYSQRTANGPH